MAEPTEREIMARGTSFGSVRAGRKIVKTNSGMQRSRSFATSTKACC